MTPDHTSAEKLNEDQMVRFHDSLTRCTSSPGFLERFYKLFLQSSPEVRKKFAQTNWLRQYRMIVASFHLMVLAEDGGSQGGHLGHIAAVHGAKKHAIAPELYDNWLDSLLQAVEETDPEYDEELRDLWRRVMVRGIDFMRSRYDA